MSRAPSRRDPTVLWVMLAALAVLSVIALRTDASLSFLKYPAAAEHILAGTLGEERLIDFSPLYLGLHLFARRWLPAPETTLLALQTLLAGLAVGLLFVLLCRRVGRRLALLGATAFLLNRNLLVHQSILEPEIVLVFLLLVVLVAADRPGRGAALVAGLAGALALATRPSLLPLLALVPMGFLLGAMARGKTRRVAIAFAARRGVVFALPILLTFGLLMTRSARITGDWLAPAMNPGTVFFEGNNPLSFGTSAVYPPAVAWLSVQPSADGEPDRAHRFYREVARASTGRDLSVREVNAYWQGRALAFMKAEPRRWIRLEIGKLTLAFHNVRLHDVATAWFIERKLGLLPTVPFALVGALALLGLLVEARHWRRSLLFYALFASQTAVMLVFYVSARQRLALLPAAVYFAVIAVERLRQPGRALLLVLAALLAACLLLPHPQLAELAYQRRHAIEAQARTQEVQKALARDPPAWHLEKCIDLLAARHGSFTRQRPAFLPQEEVTIGARVVRALSARGETSAPARFDLAIALLAAGDAGAADHELGALADEGFVPYRTAMSITVASYRARAAAMRGDVDAAIGHLQRAVDEAPGDPFALADLVALTGDEHARERLFAYWSRLDAELLLGRAYLRAGDPGTAIGHLAFASAAVPSLREAQIDHAAALGEDGRLDQGARRFLDAHAKSVDPVLRDPEIPNLFRAWLAEAADDPRRRLATVRVLHAYGYLGEALEILSPLEQQVAERLGPTQDFASPGRFARDVLREARNLRLALAGPPRSTGGS